LGRTIESYSNYELASFPKNTLSLIAEMYGVRHSGLSAANIRRNLQQRRDMVFELRRELPENPNPNEISDLSGDAGPHDASNPNNIDTQAGEETNPSALDGDITNEPTVEAQEHPQPPQADPTQGDGGTPNPGGVINTPTSSRRSFPDTDVSAVVMQQLEALGIVPELQGGKWISKPFEVQERNT
jgi:hypothetical protein